MLIRYHIYVCIIIVIIIFNGFITKMYISLGCKYVFMYVLFLLTLVCVCVFINNYTKIVYKLGLLSICLRCNTRAVFGVEYKSYVNLGGGEIQSSITYECM